MFSVSFVGGSRFKRSRVQSKFGKFVPVVSGLVEDLNPEILNGLFLHQFSQAPLTWMVCPVMYLFSSVARNNTALAISSGVPGRPMGICATASAQASSL